MLRVMTVLLPSAELLTTRSLVTLLRGTRQVFQGLSLVRMPVQRFLITSLPLPGRGLRSIRRPSQPCLAGMSMRIISRMSPPT